MPAITNAQVAHPVLEFKARDFTLPTLRVISSDMDRVADELSKKVAQAPEFFRNSPVVIDLEGVERADDDVDFALLVGLLRGYGMLPVGVRGGSAVQNEAAKAMELAVLASGRPEKARQAAVTPTAEKARARPQARAPAPRKGPQLGNKLVTQPIRSGQRVYAAGGDLIVAAQVSSGAELLADGNIHVYGALRGRALAGVKGDCDSRIFCQNLQAELVSVAGHYRISENLQAQAGQSVQIYLRDGTLIVEKL